MKIGYKLDKVTFKLREGDKASVIKKLRQRLVQSNDLKKNTCDIKEEKSP